MTSIVSVVSSNQPFKQSIVLVIDGQKIPTVITGTAISHKETAFTRKVTYCVTFSLSHKGQTVTRKATSNRSMKDAYVQVYNTIK